MITESDLKAANELREALLAPNIEVPRTKVHGLEHMLTALVAEGHVLLEDEPGSGKTFLANLFASALDLVFRKIQFTSDLMPMDIIGWETYPSGTKDIEYLPGPVFANILLADQLNYSPPKTQSSLFEVMQEGRVTVSGESYKQLKPFLVCATCSPQRSENDGYQIVPTQLDRFLIRIPLAYPSVNELQFILGANMSEPIHPYDKPLKDAAGLVQLQMLSREVHVNEDLVRLIAGVVVSTHQSPHARTLVQSGLSIRAGLGLKRACQARALLHGRRVVEVEDIKELVGPVFSHRLNLTFTAQADGRDPLDIIQFLFKETYGEQDHI